MGSIGPVLVLDTDIARQAAVTVLLEDRLSVLAVSGAVEAIRLLRLVQPGLVILDTSIAEFDRTRLLRVLYGIDRACPLILLDARGGRARSAEVSRLRIVERFAAPVDVCALAERASEVLVEPRGEWPLRYSPPVRRAVNYIVAHYRQRLHVEDVASIVGLSASRLAHRFREESGRPLKQYVLRVRVEVAKRLLHLRSDQTLEQLADEVGFADASHFSRVFVKHARARPGAFRRHLGA